MGEPARGYSWPTFTAGNEVALRHGAFSERKVRPIADAIAAEVPGVAPWAAGPVHAAAVAAWARAEARVLLLTEWLDEHGLVDDTGQPRPAVVALERAESRAQSLRGELGLSPMSLARLLGLLSSTGSPGQAEDALERLKAAGARIVEAAEAGGGS